MRMMYAVFDITCCIICSEGEGPSEAELALQVVSYTTYVFVYLFNLQAGTEYNKAYKCII